MTIPFCLVSLCKFWCLVVCYFSPPRRRLFTFFIFISAFFLTWENSRQLATLPLVSPPNERRNSILMTRHYPDLGSASDWSCRVGNLIQPIRSTTQIWVVTRHQYGISALVSQTSFRWETSGGVSKYRLFSQVTLFPVCLVCFSAYSTYSTFMYLFIVLKRLSFSVTMILLIVLEPSRSLFGHW